MEDKVYRQIKNVVKEVTQKQVQQTIEESTKNKILSIKPKKRKALETKIRKTPPKKLEKKIQEVSDSTVRDTFKYGATPEEVAVCFENNIESFLNGSSRYRLLPIITLIIAAGIIALAVPNNHAPISEIDSITPNPAYTGENITFLGTSTDPDGDEIQEYWWWCSNDGFLGSTPSLRLNNLSPGYHVIHFKTHDSRGKWSKPAARLLEIQDKPQKKTVQDRHRHS